MVLRSQSVGTSLNSALGSPLLLFSSSVSSTVTWRVRTPLQCAKSIERHRVTGRLLSGWHPATRPLCLEPSLTTLHPHVLSVLSVRQHAYAGADAGRMPDCAVL